jgi:hypothetical protein
VDEDKTKIIEKMTRVEEELKVVSRKGESAMLFLVYIGHGATIRGETHAVMENGREFINLKDFVICCAKSNCLVLSAIDCCREVVEWKNMRV